MPKICAPDEKIKDAMKEIKESLIFLKQLKLLFNYQIFVRLRR